MRKAGSRKGAVCVAAAGVLLCGLALLWPEPQERRPFALAVGVWPGMETLTLARERGELPEQDVNFIELSWTSATMMAFENRAVGGAVVTLDEMLRLRAGGHAIKAVLVMGVSAGGDAIVARPDIKSLPDLRGKRVGVELRACGEYFLTRALHGIGMTLGDVVVVPLNLSEAENAYEQNEVDAIVCTDPVQTRLTEGGARVLFDSNQMQAALCRVLVVREDLLKKRQPVLADLARAHFAALPALRSGTEENGMDAVLRRERLSAAQFLEALDRITQFSLDANVRMLSEGPGGLGPVLRELATFMEQTGLLETEPDVEGLLDPRLVKEVEDAL